MNIARTESNNNKCNHSAHRAEYGEKLSLGIIWCAENCKYQTDGCCQLNSCGTVNSLTGICPYFTEKSFDKGDSLGEASDPDKLN